jgi:TonB family protein
VIAAEVPLYPALARAANVEGTIHVEVTTDGHRVTAARSRDGYRILADAAVKNAQTWEFATHEPTTFTITYRYRLVAKLTRNLLGPTVILRLPTEVEVLAMPRVINDPPP